MKKINLPLFLLLICGLFGAPKCFAQGTTAFFYQGRLNGGGSPLNGSYDLSFSLYSASAGGTLYGQITNPAVNVVDGMFGTKVDFGANLDGKVYWLELSARSNAAGPFITLSPRQQILPTPYAMFASSSSNIVGALPATQLSGVLPSAQFAGTYSNPVWLSNPLNLFTGDGGGLTNLNASALAYGFVPAGRIAGTYTSPIYFSNTGNIFSGTGTGLTALDASQLTTGTLPDSRLAGTYSSVVALTNGGNTLGGNGAAITGLNASQLTSGSVPDARLSLNVPLLTSGNLNISSSGGFSSPQLSLTQKASDFCRLRLTNPSNSWDFAAGLDGALRFYNGADNLVLSANGDATVRNDINFGTTTRQMLNLWSTNHGIGVQGGTTYFRSGDAFAWYAGGGHVDTGGNPGVGGRVQMALNGNGRLAVGQSTASGDYTFASGGSQATGYSATALGGSFAGGSYSFGGGLAEALGDRSAAVAQGVAHGYSSFAACQGVTTGTNSVALANSTANGDLSVALAGYATSQGYASLASGTSSAAYGTNAVALGSSCVASNSSAVAIGSQNVASGLAATALGVGNHALSYAEVAVGSFNLYQNPYNTTAEDSRDVAFSIGVGLYEGVRNNAMTVLKNSYVGIGGSIYYPTHQLQLPNSSQSDALAYAWNTYSDRRLKDDISPLPYGLETVMKLQPHQYLQHGATIKNGIVERTGESKKQIGFVAQELYDVVPEAVTKPKDENGEFWAADSTKLVPVLAKAIQELKAENDLLKRRLDALERASTK